MIDLFVWPDKTRSKPPATARLQGYNIIQCNGGGMTFSAVSGLEAKQLREFAEDWRRSP
jgi:hypothetical protein